MGYDNKTFQESNLLATIELCLPDLVLHLRFSYDGYVACSILTTLTIFNDTETAKLLWNTSPTHDFISNTRNYSSIPLGYTTTRRIINAFNEFVIDKKRTSKWTMIIALEPLGFVFYGRWQNEIIEILLQDARGTKNVEAIYIIPSPVMSHWLDKLQQLNKITLKNT